MSIFKAKSDTSLPLPAISSSVRVSVSRSRRRLALLLIAVLAFLSFGRFFQLHSLVYFVDNKIPFIEYPSFSSPANPDALPIYWGLRKPEVVHKLPTQLKNPWPDRPEIAAVYFAPDRPVVDPPVTSFPTEQDVYAYESEELEAGRELKKPLTKIPFESIEPPASWSRETSPGNLGQRKNLNKIQWPGFSKPMNKKRQQITEQRLEWVKRAMRHGWEGYKKHAWGYDEIRPVSNSSQNTFGGWGASIIDSLDTLLLFGMHRDYAIARAFVREVDFTQTNGKTMGYGSGNGQVSVFETTIRYLGGLIGAYELSGDQLMLDRAIDLAEWIMGAFKTSSGLPLGRYRFGDDHEGKPTGRCILSEAGSLSLEYTRLYQITGRQDFYELIQRVTDALDTRFEGPKRLGRLLPQFIIPESTQNLAGSYSFGALADSYYEYLVKEDLLLGRATTQYERMYTEAIDSMHDHLIVKVSPLPGQELTVLGTKSYGSTSPYLEHLTCFAGAMLGLGSQTMNRPKDLAVAQEVTKACFWTYNSTESGIAPEWTQFYTDTEKSKFQRIKEDENEYLKPIGTPTGVKRSDPRYIGRPETIESVFYMYRITGDPEWQDIGWRMFTSWVNGTVTSAGYATALDVNANPPPLEDSMESFVLAETLKYYFLLFSPPDVMSLDHYVFNTEAHGFRIPGTPVEKLWKGPDMNLELKYSQSKQDGELPVAKGSPIQAWNRLGRDPPAPQKL